MTGFAEDYFEARSRFLTAAARAGLAVETYWHPHAKAPNGAPLALDVARAGSEDATHILFTVCGTHGVEGYPGSAAQVRLIESGRLETLPEHVAVVFLHGLNPYGWSRDSQRNEDGIDINRNFVDFANLPEPDRELVARFAQILDIREMSFGALGNAAKAFAEVNREVGGKRYMQTRAAGQYLDPKSSKFGGSGPSWSNTTYRAIVRKYLGRAKRVAELDWHTGLGLYGDIFPLCFADPKSGEFGLTCDWWGREGVERGARSWSAGDEDTPVPGYNGIAHCGLVEELPDARIAGGVVEFGTLPIWEIAQVGVLDHWLLYNAPKDADIRFWRAQMRTMMAPREPGWERSVLKHAEKLYANTLDGLARWGRN